MADPAGQHLQFQPAKPRLSATMAGVLAVAGIVLTVASCTGSVTPLGPDGGPAIPPVRQLGSALTLQDLRTQPSSPSGGCATGYAALTGPGPQNTSIGTGLCYRKVGAPVTLTRAAVSGPITQSPSGAQAGQAQATSYVILVTVPAADVAAVTALIKSAYTVQGAMDVSTGGTNWSFPQVIAPFPGRQLQIALPSMSKAAQLYRVLVPAT